MAITSNGRPGAIRAAAGLKPKALKLLAVLQGDHSTTPPRFEKLVGDLSGAHSRRIDRRHRFVHQVREEEPIIKVRRMWSHYE